MRSEKLPAAAGSRKKRAKEYDLLSSTVCQSSGLESLSLGGGCTLGSSASSSFPLSSPIDSAEVLTSTCQGCAFSNVELLNNSFLANFLPGGCAILPSDGIDYQPWSKGPMMRVFYSDSDPDCLVYRVQDCTGEYVDSALRIAQKKTTGSRPSAGDGGKYVICVNPKQQPFRVFYCLSLYKNTYVACEKCRALIKVRPLHQRVQTAVKHDYYYYFCHHYNLFTLMFLYVLVASITFK